MNKTNHILTRRNFLKALIGGGLLLGGGVFLGKGTWYRQVANGMRNLTNDLDFQCLIFPDSQSSDYSDWEHWAQEAAWRNPEAAFFVNMGDIVDNGEDHTQWQASS
ncbi:hypothetical protein SAMN05216584_10554 [Selenomonas sp. WCT3]|uniref:hypothetical protein n=1 Tax=Selenomonas sp. WCT3 TaxID=3158785 RepID=UPI0008876400|nr:hypothetical protein SAMN05216584_10554 [Selenomonas ruminantium]